MLIDTTKRAPVASKTSDAFASLVMELNNKGMETLENRSRIDYNDEERKIEV